MVYSKDDRIQKCIGLPKLMDGTMREVLTMKNVSQKEILFFKKSFKNEISIPRPTRIT